MHTWLIRRSPRSLHHLKHLDMGWEINEWDPIPRRKNPSLPRYVVDGFEFPRKSLLLSPIILKHTHTHTQSQPPSSLKKCVSQKLHENSGRNRHSCRILLISDFSEECDDELAFVYLIQGCKKYTNISFVVDLLVTDTAARIQWFEYIYKEKFEQKKWSWIDPLWLRHSCTDLQFNAASNVVVRMYCTETSKRDTVRSRLPKVVTETIPLRKDVPNHTKIPQDKPLHFILWNSPIPTSITPSWFEKFSNNFGGLSRLSFEDGIVRTFQTGGPGSINSKPHDHFLSIAKALGMNRKVLLMLTPEFTRKILLSREMVDSLDSKMRSRVYVVFDRATHSEDSLISHTQPMDTPVSTRLCPLLATIPLEYYGYT